MRRNAYILILAAIVLSSAAGTDAFAQRKGPKKNLPLPPSDTIEVNAGDRIDTLLMGAETIGFQANDFANIDTVPPQKKYKSRHMLGVKYSYDLCKVSANPTIGEKMYMSPLNLSLMYTYYHDLWDYLDVFGLQFGVKYGREGYNSEYSGWGESVQMLQFPLGTQVHINFWKMRLLVNLGTYYGYKLSTDKSGGFDENDIRHDYGAYGGAGIGFVFGPFELHFEGNYQFSLCSMYHTYKYSDLYWMSVYPRNICISAGLFINLW